MSLGLVVLEKKLFTRTPTPQSDDIMSADIKRKIRGPCTHRNHIHVKSLPQVEEKCGFPYQGISHTVGIVYFLLLVV